jgi:tetratricopeptide (TPR) repeat protein
MMRFGMKFGGYCLAMLVAVAGGVGTGVAGAQATPPAAASKTEPGMIHGHVNNPLGQPLTKGEVKLTTDRATDEKTRKYAYTFPISATGDYKGEGVAPANYLAIVFQDGKSIDYIDKIDITAGTDKEVNFDMSREEYLKAMKPEDRKALEDFKKKNADITAENAKIQNLNALLTQARADNKAKNYDASIKAMTTATAARPEEAILWETLADAQLGSADAAASAAKTAHTNPSDPAIVQKYKDAEASYQKALTLNAAAKKPNPEMNGAANYMMGQAMLKSGDSAAGIAAVDAAAKADPTKAGFYYYNAAAMLLNAGDNDNAAIEADKTTAADPKKADAYYIKATALVGKATVDPKTQVIVAPPGCMEAYKKYLELDPQGPHAKDVEDILTSMGQKVTSTYKAGRKG